MRSVVARRRIPDFGWGGADNETAIFTALESNLEGKNLRGQCLAGSFSGAESSKRVTEESIKVGLARMEIGLDV